MEPETMTPDEAPFEGVEFKIRHHPPASPVVTLAGVRLENLLAADGLKIEWVLEDGDLLPLPQVSLLFGAGALDVHLDLILPPESPLRANCFAPPRRFWDKP